MNTIIKKPFATAATLALATALLGNYNSSIMHAIFGKKVDDKSDKSTITKTKTYIWGNGFYQARPDIILSFKNFTPKLIKNFFGDKGIRMRDIIFGESHEAGIDVNGQVYAWKKHRIDSAMENKDDERSGIVVIDNSKNNKQITFSRGFLWILKDNGEVHQHLINRKPDQKDEEYVEIVKAPRKIAELTDITQISTGDDHFVALDKNGDVWVMGDDTLGQCGQGAGDRTSSPPYYERRLKKPRKLESLGNIQKIVCGGNHTIALTRDGTAYGWGSNSNMQLSHQEEFARIESPLIAVFAPVKIEKNMSAATVTDIAAGQDFSIFVGRNRNNNESEVFGCGHNMHGQLGGGNMSHVQDVMKIESLSNYKISTPEGERDVRTEQISCGRNHCMALLSVGAVLEWGANEFGQLGNKKRVFSENPIILKTFAAENVVKISCGEDNSAVICEDKESK